MKCEIEWSVSPSRWDEAFETAPRPSLLQSRAYGEAITGRLGQKLLHAVAHVGGKPVALLQVQEASLFRRTIHAVILDRGPVWLGDMQDAKIAHAVFAAFDAHVPRRHMRKRRVIPEIPQGSGHHVMNGLTFCPSGAPGYQTIWVDLSSDEPRLRARLKPKWRNTLAKAEAAGLTLEWDWQGKSLSAFLAHYASDQLGKGYPGPDPGTLRALAKGFGQNAGIAMAWDGDVAAAGILVFRHGRSATWQTGWVAERGRKTGANALLLWEAMLTLKDKGTTWFDLGGINDKDAVGVMRFKQGLGGTDVTLAGPYK